MDIRRLQHFIAVADSRNISRAAELLGMAQPALSLSIARLETELGVRLFRRSRRGAEITAAGQALLEHAREAVSRAGEMSRLAGRLADGSAGRLSIGFTSSALYRLLPDGLRKFRALLPDVEIVLEEMSSNDQLESLRAGRIDVGLLLSPASVPARIAERVVTSEQMLAAVPAVLDIAARDTLSLRDIAPHGLIVFPENQGALRTRLLNAIRKCGVDPLIVQEARRGTTILSCVSAGIGVALLPESIRALAFDGVRYCSISESGRLPVLEMSAIWRKSSGDALARQFVSLL
jgi:DNA-binding transcriptional LysR family regulator